MKTPATSLTISIFLFASQIILSAQPCNGCLETEWIKANYSKREVMIPMRDGASLSTAIYEPLKPRDGGSPIMMTRTPYGLRPYGEEFAGDLGTTYKNYLFNGYIIVYQSVRGTYLSEGEFVNVRPVVTDRTCCSNGIVDDASDTYDTIEWLLDNTSNNGCVGVKGVSYPGFYSTIAALCGHPALKASSPQAPVCDWFMGDDFHHNGALMLADFNAFTGFLCPRRNISENGGKHTLAANKVTGGLYEHFLGKGIDEITAILGDSIEFWNAIKAHPDYDQFWKDAEPTSHFNDNMPAMLVVGGLFDAEDFYGPYKTYREMLARRKDDVYFVEGPWYHGAWRNMDYNHLDGAWFGNNSTAYYLDNIEYPFFAYYLEGKGEKIAPVHLLPSGETSPEYMAERDCSTDWETLQEWPSLNKRGIRMSLQARDGSICIKGHVMGSGRKSTGGLFGFRSYTSDPSSPVPYYHEASTKSRRDRDYMAGDQRGYETRPDVLTYKADEQQDTLYFLGPVKVHLRLRQNCADADYIVKLIDERPDGYQMLVRADVMPARYRNGFSKSIYLKPRSNGWSRKFTLDFTMPDIAHKLLPGHRLIIQIQSSWFPLVAMNPQNDVAYYEASWNDYKIAEMHVLNGSYIEIPIRTTGRCCKRQD